MLQLEQTLNFTAASTMLSLMAVALASLILPVITAYNNGLDRAIDVVITNVMQITLFVMPSVVLLGWAIDQPMQLEFGFLETLCFFLGVFVVSLLVHDRKINYLGGAVCIAM